MVGSVLPVSFLGAVTAAVDPALSATGLGRGVTGGKEIGGGRTSIRGWWSKWGATAVTGAGRLADGVIALEAATDSGRVEICV